MHHPLETAVASAAALVGLTFALATFERWLTRRRRHELAWSVALLLFTVAAAALAAGAQGGWSGPDFRTFYLFGAIVNVPVLALGTVYLLAGQRWGDPLAAVVGLFAAFAAGVVVTAPFTGPLPVNELVQGSRVFGVLPRLLAGVGSAGGAVVIFAGAVWSAWRVRRSAGHGPAVAPRRLLWSNVLIALGTLVLGGSGTLNSVFGAMTAFAVTLLIGIVVIFAGFLVATVDGPTPAAVIPPAEPWWPAALAARPSASPGPSAGLGAAASRPGRGAVTARS